MTLDDLASAILGTDADTTSFGTRSFIELGGDSLRAMRLDAMAKEQLGLTIPLRALLGGESLATALSLARAVEKPATEQEQEQAQELNGLSHTQRGMWLIESITGGSPYNLVFTAFVERGELDLATFRTAVDRTVARNEGLRTVFTETETEGDGSVRREVLAAHSAEFDCFTHDGDPADFEEHVRRTTDEQSRRPFDLKAAPAVRFLHFAHPSGRQAVVLTAHHMVLDGWSVGLALKEVFAHYEELAGGAPTAFGPGVALSALIRSQEEQRAAGLWDQQAEFWAGQLAAVPTVLELPADRQRPPVQDAAGARAPLDLGGAASAAVGERARELGITPYALLLGAFGLTLSRTTGARSLLVGVPLLGRGTAELADLVGVAGNLVPVRIDVDDDKTAAEYLRSVQRSLTLSIDAGQLPFEELVARLGLERSIGCHPLVQVCFGMHDQLVPQRLTTRTLDVRIEEGHGGGAQFDLTLLVGQSEPSLAGHLEYATAVWNEAEAAGFIADFRAAAEQLAGSADLALEEVRCLSEERRAQLAAINAVREEFPATSLDKLFRDAAQSFPDAVAVRDGSVELTYAQLASAAAEQARLLAEAGVRPGDTVLIGVERSIAEAVAILGILTAGAAYVGVDLNLPVAHTRLIVAKAAPTAALVVPEAAGHQALQGVATVGIWDASWTPERDESAQLPKADQARQAYVAFTSGSTGEPKGVSVPHRAVIRLVHEAGFVRTGPGETMLRLSPLAFDASTLEVWGALLTGATLEVYPADALPSPTELGAFLLEREVTVAWLTAGLFRLVEEFAPASLGGLKQLLTGGDVVPHDHAARALARHPGLVITNGYGPTENTTFTTTHTVRRPEDVSGPLPIGTPVPGTRVYVLDERGRQVPPGAVGELYTGGEGLADGYVGDEAETARRFGHFSADVQERLYRTGDVVRLDTRGRLGYLGRSDDQVKLRGYRIELSAISDALKSHPQVKDSVVVVTGDNSAEKRLVAAVVLAPDAGIGTGELRDLLSGTLPSYMVPPLWALVESIPLTPNGKVDRKALAAAAGPAGQSAPAASAAAQSAAEDALARISALFTEAIERTGTRSGGEAQQIGADTDFFVSGGTSLGAVQLIRLVKEQHGVTLKLRDLLLTPTPTGVLQLVRKAGHK
ncbi:amino acid adenylation domain-containing protein [Kitasatospora sp. MAP12-15]|uniref:non-ribosomal peptide synthetase n=1 Tax=unclassified Kitasatospora TaxID=2633591 RepID=UPI0024738303|nr:amino acid adenylation domain-containing protein [Kitasatospora sp. MAP12-44]MDH6112899.1 amino acid adenylation domain-containing protein [Kitasatospora sp. MAP12-44]